MTVEQMCRDLLAQATKDGLVFWINARPQILTAGELAGTANLLTRFLGQELQAAQDPYVWMRMIDGYDPERHQALTHENGKLRWVNVERSE